MRQATVYENYRNVDETTPSHKYAATTTDFLEQQTPSTEIQQMSSKQKPALRYFIDKEELISELATGMKGYAFTAVVPELGVTYILGSSAPPAIARDIEQEIEVVVRMSPKAVRHTVVRITAHYKGMPNPIL
jgi:hypothetical protein